MTFGKSLQGLAARGSVARPALKAAWRCETSGCLRPACGSVARPALKGPGKLAGGVNHRMKGREKCALKGRRRDRGRPAERGPAPLQGEMFSQNDTGGSTTGYASKAPPGPQAGKLTLPKA